MVTVLGRLIDFGSDGTPYIEELQNDQCGEPPDVFRVARFFDTSDDGTPYVAVASQCCFGGYGNRKELTCYTGGITETVGVYVLDNVNCASGQCLQSTLSYDSGTGTWTGSITLRNGGLNLKFECLAGVPENDPAKLKLTVSGCDSGVYFAGYDCADPLTINFAHVNTNTCCCCNDSSGFDSAAIDIWITANCKAVGLGRIIDYGSDGTPYVATTPSPCFVSNADCQKCGCDTVQCGLTLIATGSGDCSCLSQTIAFEVVSSLTWQTTIGNGVHGCSALVSMTCGPGSTDGTTKYSISVTCGATNAGNAQVSIDSCDVEDLDITFNVTMVDPGPGDCGGICWYDWNDMTLTWDPNALKSTCTVSCDACPNSPDDPSPPPPGVTVRTQSCTSTPYVPPCCRGALVLRCVRPC